MSHSTGFTVRFRALEWQVGGGKACSTAHLTSPCVGSNLLGSHTKGIQVP